MTREQIREWTRRVASTPPPALLAVMLGLSACGSSRANSGESADARGGDLRVQGAEVLTSGDPAGNGPRDVAGPMSDVRTSSVDLPRVDGFADLVSRTDSGTSDVDSQALGPDAAVGGSDAVTPDLARTPPDTKPATDPIAGSPDATTLRPDSGVSPEVALQPDVAGIAADAPPPDTAQPAPDAAIPDTRPPAPDATTLPRLPNSTGAGTFAINGRATSAIEVVVPTNIGPRPPLVISFHPTGGTQAEAISQFELDTKAVDLGFIAVAPRAGYRNGQHPADLDHDLSQGDSSWNMWDPDPATNDDLRYVAALIDAAQQTYGVDTSRVYTMGFSNGAFFAYFAAASLPDRIAGFAENSGGWTTDACPTRYWAESAGLSYTASVAPAGISVGDAFACSVLFAASGFPVSCRISATNHLLPPSPVARVPFGYLAHYSSDTIVSAQWSCILAEALGSRAQTTIRFSDPDIWGGPGSVIRDHSVMPDFFDHAWAFFAGRTNTQ